VKISWCLVAALVCVLTALPAFSQQSKEETRNTNWFTRLTKPEMVLPDSLKSDVVVFRRGPLRNFHPLPRLEFLPYRVGNLKRGLKWNEIWDLFDVKVNADTDRQSLSFTLFEDEAERWNVACRWGHATRTVSAQIAGVIVSGDMVVTSHQCLLRPVSGDQRWTLELETSAVVESPAREPDAGRLTDGKVVYEITPSYAKEAALGVVPVAGYLFTVDQEPVAAVTANFRSQCLIFRNSVSPEDRSLLAAAAFAPFLAPRDVNYLP